MASASLGGKAHIFAHGGAPTHLPALQGALARNIDESKVLQVNKDQVEPKP
jgi:hypothetical protein